MVMNCSGAPVSVAYFPGRAMEQPVPGRNLTEAIAKRSRTVSAVSLERTGLCRLLDRIHKLGKVSSVACSLI